MATEVQGVGTESFHSVVSTGDVVIEDHPSSHPHSNGDVAKTNGDVTKTNGHMKSNGQNGAPASVMENSTSVLSSKNPSDLNRGPDQVAPADSLYSTRPDVPVRIRSPDPKMTGEHKSVASMTPVSIPSHFTAVVRRVPDKVALASKPSGSESWVNVTYTEYLHLIRTTAKAFIKLGLNEMCGVSILGFNAPEWFISDLAAIFAGGLAVGVYTTNSADSCRHVIADSRSNIVVVEDNKQLEKILQVRDQLPDVKSIVMYREQPTQSHPGLITWSELLKIGEQETDTELEARLSRICINKACALVYTSGTTGNPKGVMISHDNLMWTGHTLEKWIGLRFGEERIISYLPLSHIAAQLMELYGSAYMGSTCYFAQPDALKGSIATTMKEVQPTLFLGVPRVWEKIQEKMVALGKNTKGLRRKLVDWAKSVGLQGSRNLMDGLRKKKRRQAMPWGWTLANALVFRRIQDALGLGSCRYCVSAAAPITMDTLEFFAALNIQIREIYGMSESCGPHAVSLNDVFRFGAVGKEFYGASTLLHDADSTGEGEICMSGRHVFMGYINNEEKTHEALDSDGWLHSGDLGRKDKDGFLSVTGRIKELIITAGGENIAPVPIENHVKAALPCVANCVLIGDKRKFLSMLITLKTTVNLETGSPEDKLDPVTLEWVKSNGSSAQTLTEILESKDHSLLHSIQKGIDKANSFAVSRAQKIQKWSLLPRDFSVTGGELGPSLKLKRPVVHKMYAATIETFYSD